MAQVIGDGKWPLPFLTGLPITTELSKSGTQAGKSERGSTTKKHCLRWVNFGRRWWVKFQCRLTPLVTAFRAWLDDHAAKVPPKSLLGKAIAYALGQWSRLEHYLEDGRLRMDNNLAENAIRPFVVGRKNWLFSGSVAGAAASATIYSLIESAKANRLDPYWYLRYLFDHLPLAKDEEDILSLLPNRINPTLITNRMTPAQAQAV